MKKRLLIPLTALALLGLIGCSKKSSSGGGGGSSITGGGVAPSYTIGETTLIDEPTITGVFNMSGSTSAYTVDGNKYTITAAGTFTLSGVLEGQIVVDAGSNDAVILELNGVSISYSSDSPIKIVAADNVKIKAMDGTVNVVKDMRSEKKTDVTSVGEGAINSKVDLGLVGKGTLIVEGNYNNGIHCTKDLSIKNQTLQVVAVNNALKGKDSVTISSGSLTLVSKEGTGIKTDNSDVSSKGNQRGTITIEGGDIVIDSAFLGIEAAYNAVIDQIDSRVSTSLLIKTGLNSLYKDNYVEGESAHGIKAENEIIHNAGNTIIAATGDGVHAKKDMSAKLDNGNYGLGNFTMGGGQLIIESDDDALHADYYATVNAGTLVLNGGEAFEANHIIINNGNVFANGVYDGVNAANQVDNAASFTMKNGFLDVTVQKGDTDGIDSNGTFTQTGGLIVSRGSYGTTPSGMSTALDCDSSASVTGGTFIAFNGIEASLSTSNVNIASYGNTSSGGNPGGGPGGGPKKASSSGTLSSGTYKLTGTNVDITFLNKYEYGAVQFFSDSLKIGESYSLNNGDITALSWTQSSSNVTIS